MKTELTLKETLVRFIAYASLFVDGDDIPKEDLSRLEAAELIVYYDAGYFLSYDALELLTGSRNVPGDQDD